MSETMADFEKELEASLRPINEGDIVEGIVTIVDEDAAYVDFNYHIQGVVKRADFSDDPSFNMHTVKEGDKITAEVISTDDGKGNVALSVKNAVRSLAWDTCRKYLEEAEPVTVKIGGIVNKGVIAYLEGLRGFIPVSQLALGYVEDTNEFLGKTVEALVITVDEKKNRLVLSVRELLQKRQKEEKEARINSLTKGTILEGKVEKLMPYGAFIDLGEGLSGLVHISQISRKRIASPGEVLKVGQQVKVKVQKVEDGKIGLTMKSLEESAPAAEIDNRPKISYKDEGEATTGLASLLAGIKLD